ncbi:MAG: CopD family protein, partial [Acetobacteraceae bacterium]|nr:CopD family protein [Acetobacteraceae bacterium]
MSLLVDLFGYLSVIVHGLVIVAQSLTIGGVLFLVLLARPLAGELAEGAELARRTARLAAWSATGLLLCEALTFAMQTMVLIQTLGLAFQDVLGAEFAIAGLVKMAAAAVLASCLFAPGRVGAAPLVGLCVVVLAASVMTTHSAARLADNRVLMAATAFHLLGAAIWIGGIPSFVMALRQVHGGGAFRRVGARFSRMSMVGVLCILASAVVFTAQYIGTWKAAYGTAYGVMVGAKVAMFGALLLLGLGNFLVVERLRTDQRTSVLRLRRFAEVEIGIGLSIFFAAASLTSVPPAVDLKQDRVTWAEIARRNIPEWPRLQSPDHDSLALPALQAQLDREAAEQKHAATPAFVPGSGELPARNAADVAWSEYNHHWAGLFVSVMGVLALLHRAGLRWARHWPLLLLGMAGFLFVRADPEVWPLGEIGF